MDQAAPATTRYIALLRAINVGGHTVKMERLRELFAELGYQNVATFIASGNVIFEAAGDEAAVAAAIEAQLQAGLGYAVPALLRTDAELAAVAARQPFAPADVAAAGALMVAFAAAPITAAAAAQVAALRTAVDEFAVHGREVHWLCRGRFSESLVTGPRLERALGQPVTVRSSTTVCKLAAKYPPR